MNEYLALIKDNANNISSVLEHFENEYALGREEVKIKGKLMDCISQLPCLYEIRFSQLQELEAILDYFNTKMKGIKSTLYQKFMNNSARALSSTDVKQYIDGDKTVLDLQLVINDIVLVRNKFLSLSKGFETKQYMLNNITRLQCAGLDSVII
jgi:hypothetical protein